jgi:hypothetical protein
MKKWFVISLLLATPASAGGYYYGGEYHRGDYHGYRGRYHAYRYHPRIYNAPHSYGYYATPGY